LYIGDGRHHIIQFNSTDAADLFGNSLSH